MAPTIQSKHRIIELFLEFVAGFVRLDSAKLATLGGQGLEASIWHKRGVPAQQGWLVECDRDLSMDLVRKYRYRYCKQLDSFPHAFEARWGTKKGIDSFHLDLCGTFEPNSKTFGQTIPLIMRSKGRCFAVTVADQRRNTSVEKFIGVFEELGKLVGSRMAESFYYALEEEQERLIPSGVGETADPTLGAKREFGFATSLLSRMREAKAYELDRIERYLYTSERGGQPFRMRTYFFHFSRKGRGRRKLLDPRAALRLWQKSVPQYVDGEGKLISISNATPTPQKGKEAVMKQEKQTVVPYANLAAFVAMSSPPIQAEFNKLIEDAAVGTRLRAAGLTLTSVNGVAKKLAVAPVGAATPASDAKLDSSIAVQIGLLIAKADSEKAYAKAVDRAFVALGLTGRKHAKKRNHVVGALFARTQGKFRGNFVKRVLAAKMPLGTTAELAKAYSAIEGKTITVEDLEKEAVAAK